MTANQPHPSAPPPYWSPAIASLQPYVPGEQAQLADLVKLNTNENPYPPSPAVIAAIQQAAATGLERYPEPTSRALREALATRLELDPDQVFVGNGSDEVLAHAFAAFFRHPGQALLFPDITYSFYRVYAQYYGITAELLPLDDRLNVDSAALAERAGRGCAGVVVANPNAPTGIGLPLAAIESLLAACPDRVVLVDEAYVDFGGQSAVPLLRRYSNLLVVHTFSKSRSLAGLRVGYACGHPALIEGLTRVKDSFNSYPLDRLASAGAIAALADEDGFNQACQRVIESREQLRGPLQALGFEVLPSQANFLFVRHPRYDAAQLAAALRERAILVRHFSQARIAQHLRITIGTPAQCQRLVTALAAIVAV